MGGSDSSHAEHDDGEADVTDIPEVTPRVGGRLPKPGTPERLLYNWVATDGDYVEEILESLGAEGRLFATFLTVLFDHEDYGRASAVAAVVVGGRRRSWLGGTIAGQVQRLRRLAAVPISDFGWLTEAWQAGSEAAFTVQEAPPKLRVRLRAIGIKWSWSVPIYVAGEWAGLLGVLSRHMENTEQLVELGRQAGEVLAERMMLWAWEQTGHAVSVAFGDRNT